MQRFRIRKPFQQFQNSSFLLLKENSNIVEVNSTTEDGFNQGFIELKKIREKELRESDEVNSEEFKLKIQELQLVIEQLIWLTNLSESVLKNTKILMEN